MNKIDSLYEDIEKYALERHLDNVLLALPIVREKLISILRKTFRSNQQGTTSCEHCLESTKFLMDLHIGFDQEKEDILLASMLCHDMMENEIFSESGMELVNVFHLNPEVLTVSKLMKRKPYMSDEDKDIYYKNIQNNKNAVLVMLADRCNQVEYLTSVSIAEASVYVSEMRKFILPLCVYAKEYYPDCQMPVTIMMEKIRCLIDVSDIISNRYEKRELAYANEILQLLEENARLRGMIRKLESESNLLDFNPL